MLLIDYLKKEGLTNQRFSQLVGASASAISHIKNYRRLPSPKLARKIAKVTKNKVTKEELRPDIWPSD